MRALFDKDADLALIRSKKVAILGYGNQGRPQALNLRDSGVAQLKVALREGGDSAARAAAEGFDVVSPAVAADWADVIAMLIPDECQRRVYDEELVSHLRGSSALAFAHGLAIRFDLIAPRPDLDVFLLAPKGPGTALRDDYVKGSGLVALFAVAQDASGEAEALALSYGTALGCGRAGMIETSFAEEAEADLFNEAAVIWGAIPELIHAGFETLVEAGFSPEVAYFECLEELKLIADLITDRGIAGMRAATSNTAQFAALEGGPRIVTTGTRTEMRRILRDVRSGHLARALLADAEAGYPRLKAARAAAAAHPIENAQATLSGLKR